MNEFELVVIKRLSKDRDIVLNRGTKTALIEIVEEKDLRDGLNYLRHRVRIWENIFEIEAKYFKEVITIEEAKNDSND